MVENYHNSLITVAATYASGDHDFLKPRHGREVIKLPENGGRYLIRTGDRMTSDDARNNWPLPICAWIFQEDLLSARVLEFTNQQMSGDAPRFAHLSRVRIIPRSSESCQSSIPRFMQWRATKDQQTANN